MSALLTPAVLGDLNIAWITTRAAGIVALLASTGSIVLGLSLAGRMPKGRGKLGDVRMLHQTLGIATVVALAVHVISLMFDPWLKPAISELAIPFTLSYRPVWTGLGIIAGYGIVVLGMSGFLRKRLGKRWNVIHRFTGLAWIASIAHTIGAGSDYGTIWMAAILLVCVVPVVLLAIKRIAEHQRKTPRAHPRTMARQRAA
jgi:sulfoxide reductase heme-binding subunit YedZ